MKVRNRGWAGCGNQSIRFPMIYRRGARGKMTIGMPGRRVLPGRVPLPAPSRRAWRCLGRCIRCRMVRSRCNWSVRRHKREVAGGSALALPHSVRCDAYVVGWGVIQARSPVRRLERNDIGRCRVIGGRGELHFRTGSISGCGADGYGGQTSPGAALDGELGRRIANAGDAGSHGRAAGRKKESGERHEERCRNESRVPHGMASETDS